MKPDDAGMVRKRLEELFLLYYLMLIAIIEGVTFILLVERLFEARHEHNWLLHWPYALFSLVLVMVITFQYSIFLAMFRWTLGVWDTVFPFLIGFLQSAQVFYFGDPEAWWWWLSALSAMGFVTMYFTRSRLPEAHLVIADRGLVEKSLKAMLRVLAASAAGAAVVALLSRFVWPGNNGYAAWFLLTPLLLTFLFYKHVNRAVSVITGLADEKEEKVEERDAAGVSA